MIIVITGPTAVGKTKLSIELAKRLNGEIINADSTQVYKQLDIATAKVIDKENIVHHLIDIKNIDENYTVFDYQKDARKVIYDILSRNKTPILVGGTGLYIKACLYDYQFSEEEENESFNELTTEQIYDKLTNLDSNHQIHKNNRKRLIRALNYVLNNKTEYSLKTKTDKILYDTVFIGLTCDREVLYNRINDRVDGMITDGLLEEAKKIYLTNIRTKAVMTPIGYKELFPYFSEEENLENCIEKIKQNSRKYAKKQYTWFNHQLPIKWFDVDFENFDNTIRKVSEYIGEI